MSDHVYDAADLTWPTSGGIMLHALSEFGVIHLSGNPTPEVECSLCQTGSESWPIGDSGWVGTISTGPIPG